MQSRPASAPCWPSYARYDRSVAGQQPQADRATRRGARSTGSAYIHTYFLVLRPPSSGLKIHHHQRPQKAQLTQLNVNFLESQGEKQNGQNTTHRREDVNAIVKLHPRNFLMQPAESSILRQPFTGSTKLIPCVLSTSLATLVTVTPPTHRRSRILTHCWDYCTRRDCCRRTRGCKEGQAAARARLGPT